MGSWELILGILGALGVGGALTTLIGKMVPQREPASKKRADRIAELEAARDEERDDRAALRAEVAAARAETAAAREETAAARRETRTLLDHVHDLREHIVERRPPPPPDWPEGLRL